MPDENHALQSKPFDDGFDIGSERSAGPLLAVLARVAVTGLIIGDDAVVTAEGVHLALPPVAAAAPAMKEDEGRVARALAVVNERQAVGGLHHIFFRGVIAVRRAESTSIRTANRSRPCACSSEVSWCGLL